MLEIILDRHVFFVLMGILTVIGIVSKCIVNVALKRLVRAAGNMSKSNHPLMRLVRAKFEHASMISDKVENVRVFVDKYLFEYKVLGMKLHGWRRLEKIAAGLCLLAGAAGAGLEYAVNGMGDMVLKTGAAGAGLAILIYLVHLTTDENYRMAAVQNYMVDYLENVCRHRYEKTYQKEIKVLAQDNSQSGAAEFGAMPDERVVGAGEVQMSGEPAGDKEMEAGYRGINKEPKPSDAAEVPGQAPEPEVPRPIPQQSPQLQAVAKEKKSRRERVEEEIDKDVVIRRILEEFMA